MIPGALGRSIASEEFGERRENLKGYRFKYAAWIYIYMPGTMKFVNTTRKTYIGPLSGLLLYTEDSGRQIEYNY
jgi:hypothetical protein